MTADARSMTVDARCMTVDPQTMTVDARSMTVDPQTMTVDARSMTVDGQTMTVDGQSMTSGTFVDHCSTSAFTGRHWARWAVGAVPSVAQPGRRHAPRCRRESPGA